MSYTLNKKDKVFAGKNGEKYFNRYEDKGSIREIFNKLCRSKCGEDMIPQSKNGEIEWDNTCEEIECELCQMYAAFIILQIKEEKLHEIENICKEVKH